MPGSASELYTYDLCIDSCLQETFISECKCLVDHLEFTEEQQVRVNGRFCGNQSLNEISSDIDQITESINEKAASRDLANASDSLEFLHEIVDEYRNVLADERANRSLNEVMCAYTRNINVRACEAKCHLPCKEHIYSKTITSAAWPHLYYHAAFYERFIRNTSISSEFVDYEKLLVGLRKKVAAEDEYEALEEEITRKIGELDLIERNFLQVTVRFASRKPFILMDSEKYTWDSILGLFGGTIGLWSGLSVLSLLEFVDLVCCLVFYCFTTRKKSGSAMSSSSHPGGVDCGSRRGCLHALRRKNTNEIEKEPVVHERIDDTGDEQTSFY